MITRDYVSSDRMGAFIRAVYAFMGVALFVTAAVAYLVAHTPSVMIAVSKMQLFLFIAQIGLVLVLTAAIHRLSLGAAIGLFFLYAALLGVTLSVIFMVWTQSSIFQTFFTAAGMFGAMAVYGYTTRTDLTRIGSIATMIIFGMIIAILLNLYFQNSAFDLLLAGLGVILFSLLTAYDMQKITNIGRSLAFEHNQEVNTVQKMAVYGALALYLDFINLFLSLLRLMGRQKD